MSKAEVSEMRVTLRSKAQDRRISELAGLAEILRNSGYSDSTLYSEIMTEWSKALVEEVK